LIQPGQSEPESLSKADWALFARHPMAGQELIGLVEPLKAAGAIIRAHHERFDGKGYPDGAAGEGIPWLARVLAVAAYAAESSLAAPDLLDALQHGSGSQFDPAAVRAFLQCRPPAKAGSPERPVPLSELRPGMVLARGIYTAEGLLLVPGGQPLNEPCIDQVRRHYQIHPLRQPLWVYG
jgi:hypothetical protein